MRLAAAETLTVQEQVLNSELTQLLGRAVVETEVLEASILPIIETGPNETHSFQSQQSQRCNQSQQSQQSYSSFNSQQSTRCSHGCHTPGSRLEQVSI